MPVELVWSPQSREDLLDIYTTIGIENRKAAERYYDRIEARAAMLAEQPRMGIRRPDIKAPARMLVEVPYLILYEVTPDTDSGPVDSIEIVRIVDGRRDLQSLF